MEYLGQFRQPISLEAFSSLFVEKKIETIFGRKHLVNDTVKETTTFVCAPHLVTSIFLAKLKFRQTLCLVNSMKVT